MKKADTLTTPPLRQQISAEKFVKIWRGEIEAEGVFKNHIFYEEDKPNDIFNMAVANIEVIGGILLKNDKEWLPTLDLFNCALPNMNLNSVRVKSIAAAFSTIGDFSITNSIIEGGVEIKNSTVGHFWITEKSTIGDFQVKKKSSVGDFLIYNSTVRRIEVDNSTTGNFKVEGSNTGDFDIHELSETGSFLFKNSKIGDFRIRNSDTEFIRTIGSQMNDLIVTYANLKRIEVIRNCHVTRIRCRLPLQNPAQFTFSKSSFEELDFDQIVLPEFATIRVSSCKANRILFHNFCNFGAIFLSDLKVFEIPGRDSTLRLTDSDLGKIQFINCDLRQFKRFVFSNTKMLDVFVAGSQMPADVDFCLPNGEKNPLKIAEQKRLAYGQFKKIYEARGDMAGSLRYLAFEMDAYFWQLIREKPWKKTGEIIMLVLNKISTNYGNNWGQGALVTVAVIFLCFAYYLRLIGYEWGEWNETNIQLFKELFSYAPQYLNPFRDADSVIPGVKDENLRPSARVWDYASRVIVAYFIYQTIQAFRKLGKSSG